MTHGKLIFICFVLQFLIPLTFDKFEHKKALYKASLIILLIACIFNFFSGAMMAFDWDPFAGGDPEAIAIGAATHGGKGGVVILAIKFWPYLLMLLSGFYTYMSAQLLRHY